MNDTLPPLPNWVFCDDLGGLVPSEIRSAMVAYARAALAACSVVLAGFKLVPVEPTLEMLTAAGREDDKAFIDGMPHGATAADTWAAMLAAAPTPPAPDCED